jgi:hypothetical protein
MSETCRFCGENTLVYNDVQHNALKGTEFDLFTCTNRECPQFGSTRSYNERPMDEATRDAEREQIHKMLEALKARA